ncbi:hypothetical protein, partial [Actinomadura geliboluensis]|uniref:hypothetical protein n=1 Tax=Actinomadura geliboluensis TaxID=882440 RepID=UPI00197ACC17
LLAQLKDHTDRAFTQLNGVLSRGCHSPSPFQVSGPPPNPGRSTTRLPAKLCWRTTLCVVALRYLPLLSQPVRRFDDDGRMLGRLHLLDVGIVKGGQFWLV